LRGTIVAQLSHIVAEIVNVSRPDTAHAARLTRAQSTMLTNVFEDCSQALQVSHIGLLKISQYNEPNERRQAISIMVIKVGERANANQEWDQI
jgi:hypothetical protein